MTRNECRFIANGKIVEHWGAVDGTGVTQQKGLMPGQKQSNKKPTADTSLREVLLFTALSIANIYFEWIKVCLIVIVIFLLCTLEESDGSISKRRYQCLVSALE